MAKSHVNVHLVIPKNSNLEYDVPVYFPIATTLNTGINGQHVISVIQWADYVKNRSKKTWSFVIPVVKNDQLYKVVDSRSNTERERASRHYVITGIRVKSLPGGKQHVVLTSEDGIDRSEYKKRSGL